MAKIKFEEALKDLEEVVGRLEQGNLSLKDTLAEYENGIKLYKQCTALLEDAEKKIQILMKDENGELCAKDFDLKPPHAEGAAADTE